MKIGGTPKETPKEGLSFDLSEGATIEVGGSEAKVPEQRPEVEETLNKNEDGEIVVPSDNTTKKENKSEEASVVEPEGLTAIPTAEDSKEDSSLTQPDSKPEAPKVGEAEGVSMDDQAVINYLNEKYGKEYDSLDNFTAAASEAPKEDPLKDNPYLKGLVEWQERTGRPIEDYVKFQKDYGEMSDLDVVREYLQVKYPTLNDSEINVEMNKYTTTDLDLDDEAALKNLELKKLSISARSELDKLKGEFDTPVASKTSQLTPEIQKDLDLLKEIQTNFEANKEDQKAYGEKIINVSSETSAIPLKLSDDLSLNYNINEQSRKEIPSFINEMPHWKNEDGSWNHNAVVNDGIKLKHFDRIVQLVYEQGMNSGKDSIIENSKNSTLGSINTRGGSTLEGQKGAQVEGGLDKFLGNSGMTIQLKG